MFPTLRLRIIITYTLVILIGFIGLAIIAGQQIGTAAHEDFEQSTIDQVTLIARALKEPVEHFDEGEESESQFLSRLVSYEDQTGGVITLLTRNGEDWFGTSSGENFTSAPEVIAALDDRTIYDTRSNAKGALTGYTAATIIDDDHVIAVISLAIPVEAVEANIRQRWLTLISGVVILTALTVLISIFFASSLTRPLEELRQSAMQMAGGTFSQRLPEKRADEIGELSRSFNHMAEQVEAMIEEQRAFASNAAHELRTPLTTVRLRTEALIDKTVDKPTEEQYIREIDSEVKRLSGLVDDLILLSRIDSGRLERGHELIDPERFAGRLSREFETLFEEKSQIFNLKVSTALDPIEVNLNHLHIVFRNLLDNARKYTPTGGEIAWNIWQEGDSLISTISDNGQGIAPETLPNLFKRFYRGDASHSRAISGIGLGLSLARSTLIAYGGTLEISSEGVGKGTQVRVSWPLRQSEG